MANIIFVLGGARSGKSRFAEARVREIGGARRVYVATAEAFDAEMAARILRHQIDRGEDWDTVEAPNDLVGALGELAGSGATILVDCLTLWLSNRLLAGADPEVEGEKLVATLAGLQETVVLVANEVGLSVVPDTALGRSFRDAAGILNQRVAALAGEVHLLVAGLPMRLK